jgi:cyclopropane fatty-acyl-phospholipid synthase-like methyltransferase
MMFGANRGQLDDAQQVARAHWVRTGEHWRDSLQKQHEEEVVTPMDEQVTRLLRAVDQLTQLIAQVRRACETNPVDAL